MRNRLKNIVVLRYLFNSWLLVKPFFKFQLLKFIKSFIWYLSDYRKLKQNPNKAFSLTKAYVLPCLTDKTSFTPMSPEYFYQDTWAVERIVKSSVTQHYDIGSSAMTMAILCKTIPVTMIDIRPLPYQTPGLSFIKGDILDLPFPDNSIDSLSSLCVVEHIGLGRYGDEINSFGSELAVEQLKRVLKPGGNLYFSVPIDAVNRVWFNAHRAFTRDMVMSLFSGFTLIDEMYQYKNEFITNYDASREFGTGCFHFRKNMNN